MKFANPRRAAGFALSAALLACAAQAVGAPARKAPARPAAPTFTRVIEGRDLSGVWMHDNYIGTSRPIDQRILRDVNGQPVPTQPWAEKLYQERIADERKGNTFVGPPTRCLPHGIPQMMWAAAYPVQIFQTKGQIAFLHELQRQFRIVYLDRPHKPDPDHNYYGDSVGRWEGDTLVIDTVGLSERNVLDMLGMPTSDRMHVVERIRRTAPDKLEMMITVDDPGVFTRPWVRRVTYSLQPRDVEVTEYICNESNRNLVVDGKVTIDGVPRN